MEQRTPFNCLNVVRMRATNEFVSAIRFLHEARGAEDGNELFFVLLQAGKPTSGSKKAALRCRLCPKLIVHRYCRGVCRFAPRSRSGKERFESIEHGFWLF